MESCGTPEDTKNILRMNIIEQIGFYYINNHETNHMQDHAHHNEFILTKTAIKCVKCLSKINKYTDGIIFFLHSSVQLV